MNIQPLAEAMNRRSYLASVSLAGAAATAGCMGILGDSEEAAGTVLDFPDDQQADSEDLAYPAYGEELPAFELPAPLSDTVVDTAELDETAIFTGFFASCPAECGILLGLLSEVQTEIIDRGLIDDVSFYPITFDPPRDDAEMLRDFGTNVGVDLEVGNWHFLRPESTDEAKAIVEGELGLAFQRTDDSDRIETGYDFIHPVITWLVNPGGVVERLYRGERIDTTRVINDITTVVGEYDPETHG